MSPLFSLSLNPDTVLETWLFLAGEPAKRLKIAPA
jgi:hypothetical protein